jgi:hypothetical protein
MKNESREQRSPLKQAALQIGKTGVYFLLTK